MTDSTSTAARLIFGATEERPKGVPISKLQAAAKRVTILGRANVLAGQVIAIAAVLSGADVDSVVIATEVKKGVLTKGAARVRNGYDKREGATAAAISSAMHALPWDTLTADPKSEGFDADAFNDAVYEASFIWRDFLADADGGSNREPISPSKLGDLVEKNILGTEEKPNDGARQSLLMAAVVERIQWLRDQAELPADKRDAAAKLIKFTVKKTA